ncbi:HIT family protein [Saccharopolyspora sp. WRP15-2]|uniref:HIT family protein n=1 Tax=Saccharopolyspora oryzae TaxID=2997343 RepID=A0ABT4V9T5_9PSEU|nr:HIT family protein [Saccharopolyspora oryzae]MDA3630715.1 HIT family protein [Saccharopolyspora oryzae]
MHNHEPPGYTCPFCVLLASGETEINSQRDIVLRTELATALISPRWWPHNLGHVLVVPNAHHENLYDLPHEYGHAVHDVVREIAIALKTAYGCAGVSTRQHNEPAGDQDVWHHHVHVFPRYPGDDLYGSEPCRQFASPQRRRYYAALLARHFNVS